MTKKSVEILNLPIISISEGRELGTSKTLLIDAKNGAVAAITIEDEDWYRGVKLLPYSSVIAIGHDAVTITSSENILTLEDASDYEPMLDANIRVIGTKAITKSGTIQGNVVEIYVGEGGKIASIKGLCFSTARVAGKELERVSTDRSCIASSSRKPFSNRKMASYCKHSAIPFKRVLQLDEISVSPP